MKNTLTHLIISLIFIGLFTASNAQPTPMLIVDNPVNVLIDNNRRDCTEDVDITASGINFCNDLEISNDSPYGPGTHDASGRYPAGTHTIIFTATDDCENDITNEITFTVEDGKSPTVLCIYGLAIGLNQNCMVKFDASVLDGGSVDNCSDINDLDYRISLIDQDDNLSYPRRNLELTCEHLGNLRVALVVTDEAGNEAVCETVLRVQEGSCVIDSNTDCEDQISETQMRIFGSFSGADGGQINNVNVLVDGDSKGSFDGNYSVIVDKYTWSLPERRAIQPLGPGSIDNGLNILDLITIRRHILQLAPLSSYYSEMAANVNNDNKVNTLDMIEIRQAILKLIDEFSQVPSWRFIDADYVFPSEGAFYYSLPLDIEFEFIEGSELEINFIGIKMGDVNGDADATIRTTEDLVVNIENQTVSSGKDINVVFESNLDEIEAYQFTINFDPSVLEFVGIDGSLNSTEVNYNRIEEGIISVVKLVEFSSNELFQMNFIGIANAELEDALRISSSQTRAMAINNLDEALGIKLNYLERINSNYLYQNTPNPFSETTTVSFDLIEKGEAMFRVIDLMGRTIFETQMEVNKGQNSIELNKALFTNNGVFFYQIQQGEFSATNKMMLK